MPRVRCDTKGVVRFANLRSACRISKGSGCPREHVLQKRAGKMGQGGRLGCGKTHPIHYTTDVGFNYQEYILELHSEFKELIRADYERVFNNLRQSSGDATYFQERAKTFELVPGHLGVLICLDEARALLSPASLHRRVGENSDTAADRQRDSRFAALRRALRHQATDDKSKKTLKRFSAYCWKLHPKFQTSIRPGRATSARSNLRRLLTC